MPEYRRMTAPGGTFFLTLVTYERRPLLRAATTVDLLRKTMACVRQERPFALHGAIVMPDHLHLLCELPAGDTDFSTRIGMIKARFTQALRTENGVGWALPTITTPESASRLKHRESAVWQRRFWEHTIRDDDDFAAHMDYIHYNPVKHALATCPHQWPYSSFHRWVREGRYAPDWQCSCEQRIVKPPAFERIANTVGE
jgi:putative transposase